MKVTFVYPDVRGELRFRRKGYYYCGVGYLSSVLKQAGHQTSLLHILHQIDREEILALIKREDPDLIAFSSTTNMFPFVEKWSKWIKEKFPEIPTICGGIHPTLDPCGSIRVEGLDMISRGEGESALVELCEKLERGKDITDIRNIWIKADGSIYKNELRPLISDLDALPFPDREIFDIDKLNCLGSGRAIFMASRGCPYDCGYCCNHALRKLYSEGASSPKSSMKYVRFRSVDNIITEIKEVLQRYPFVNLITFDDDILPLNRVWFREFTRRYKEEIDLPWDCNLRANLVDEELIELLKDSKCQEIRIGLESGDDYIRNEILNRHLSREQLLKSFRLCEEAGLNTVSFNMVGLPFEDMSNILETIKLNALIKPNWKLSDLRVTIFYPYQGTRLFEICKEEGFLTDKVLTSYVDDTKLVYGKLTRKQILFASRYFRFLILFYGFLYRLPKPLSKLGIKITDALFRSKVMSSLTHGFLIGLYDLAFKTFNKLRAIRGGK